MDYYLKYQKYKKKYSELKNRIKYIKQYGGVLHFDINPHIPYFSDYEGCSGYNGGLHKYGHLYQLPDNEADIKNNFYYIFFCSIIKQYPTLRDHIDQIIRTNIGAPENDLIIQIACSYLNLKVREEKKDLLIKFNKLYLKTPEHDMFSSYSHQPLSNKAANKWNWDENREEEHPMGVKFLFYVLDNRINRKWNYEKLGVDPITMINLLLVFIINLYCRYLIIYYATNSQTRGPMLNMMHVLEDSRTNLTKEQFKNMFSNYLSLCDDFYDIISTNENIQTYLTSNTQIINKILSREALLYHANFINSYEEELPTHGKIEFMIKTTIP